MKYWKGRSLKYWGLVAAAISASVILGGWLLWVLLNPEVMVSPQ